MRRKEISKMKHIFLSMMLSMVMSVNGSQVATTELSSDTSTPADQLLCPADASCNGHCFEETVYNNWEAPPECYCDVYCLSYHDCCSDFHVECLGNLTNDELQSAFQIDRVVDIMEEGLIMELVPELKCRSVLDTKTPKLLLMISECNENTNMYFEDDCLLEPTKADFDMIKYITPLIYDNFVFKNIFCLLCNFVNPNFTSVTFLVPEYKCHYNDNTIVRAEELAEARGPASREYINFLLENCTTVTDTSSHVLLKSRASCDRIRNNEALYYIEETGVSTLSNMCDLYGGQINISTHYKESKHVWAACDGVQWLQIPFCYKEQGNDDNGVDTVFKSFSILLDFKSEIDKHRQSGPAMCLNDQFYDAIGGVCVERHNCGKGRVEIDDQCVELNWTHSVPNVTVGHFDNMQITLTMEDRSTDHMHAVTVVEVFMTSFIEAFENEKLKAPYFSLRNDTCWLKPNDQYHLQYEKKICEALSDMLCFVASLSEGSFIEGVPLDYSVMSEIEKFRTEYGVMNISITITNFDSHSTDLDCEYGSMVLADDLIFSRNVYGGQVIIINQTGLVLDPSSVPLGVTVLVENNETRVSYFTLLCEPEIITCDAVRLQYINITYKDKVADIYVESYGFIALTKGFYALLTQQQIVICANVIRVPGTDHVSANTNKERIDGILSATGSIISIVALSMTLFTYSLFSSMRTVPGLCVMNLSLALILAQALFLLSPQLAEHSTVCQIFGVMQHYSWLSAFLWMNVMAFKVNRTFSDAYTSSASKSKSGFRAYMVYAWGTALVFVLISLAVSLTRTLDFVYGGHACWISGAIGLGTFFGAPLAIVIVANVALFIGTVVQLKRTSDVTKGVNERTNQTLFRACIRLSSVMGFTWIFGFMANIEKLDFFWYFFILCNSLTGVFILASFVLNARVFRMYQMLFRRDTYMSRNSMSSTRSTDTVVSSA